MEKLSNAVQLVLGLGSLNSSSAAGSPSALSACQQLGATFPNNATFVPPDALYTPLAHAHWSETAWEQPTCIFLPENAAQLQTAIPLIVEHQSQFAIRAGGHLEAVGAASTNDGVLIDLSRLKRLEYHAEVQEAVLGPGLRWGDVYGYLDPFKVTVVGGRVLDVGVGGLPLGGGLSYLSDLHGMVCDNIVNYEVRGELFLFVLSLASQVSAVRYSELIFRRLFSPTDLLSMQMLGLTRIFIGL